MPALGGLARRLRFSQLLRESVSTGHFLSEPCLELEVTRFTLRQLSLEVLQLGLQGPPTAGRLGKRRSELGFSVGEPLGLAMRLFQCSFDVSHSQRERIMCGGRFRQLSLVPGLALGTLLGGRLHVGCVSMLRGLARRLRLGQLLRENVSTGHFLREPCLELEVTLFTLPQFSLEVLQLGLQGPPTAGRLGKRRGELRFSVGEPLGLVMRLFQCSFDVSHSQRERIVCGGRFRQLSLVPGLTLGTLLGGRLQFGSVSALGGLERFLGLDQTLPERAFGVAQLLAERIARGCCLRQLGRMLGLPLCKPGGGRFHFGVISLRQVL